MSAIKYPFAKDHSGNIISAKEAISRVDYFCLGCGRNMRRRQGKMRPHFTHKVEGVNCSPESILHLGFKELMYDRLQSSLTSNSPEVVQWKCFVCKDLHESNLIKKTKLIRKEMSLGVCRPDILLLDEFEKPLIAIEIVVTHEPEESTLKFYKENNIALIKFTLNSETDIELLENEILQPDFVDVCTSNPKCKTCRRYKLMKHLWIIKGRCWKCKTSMKIATIVYDLNRHYTPEDFNDKEIAFANKNGTNIQMRYSKTENAKYNVHVCRKCNSITGKFFLNKEYVFNAMYGYIKYDELLLGYSCLACE
ncbi:hypothetical protein D3P08_03835 [Paenibacillus nanensis]|uniref:Competence protein CoiA n=1 Tax=Paenibacillus nanensis TaxID=393251 RepID=A0A3A1VI52_9BACL|nr:hypothetical protein [Paenibacillus nanensis]RIX59296.1 hypothetical protein D3P08_03835 [Paenibacillus nanensis]